MTTLPAGPTKSSVIGNRRIPDIFSNEIFLRTGAGTPDWERVPVATCRGDPEHQPPNAWQGFPAVDMLRAPHADLNTYFGVSAIQTGANRSLAGFEKIFVIVLDDVGTKVDLPQAEDLLGASPSYIIETSPGNHQAGWWVEPIASRDWAAGLVKTLYEALGRGDNLKNLVGYMRLPIGVNGKAKYVTPSSPRGFQVQLVHWDPKVRIMLLDWPAIEARIGQITPVASRISNPAAQEPDPADVDRDAILQALRLLGKVPGHIRKTTMGWGFDVLCPWIDEHSDRRDEGAVYVPLSGRFHCHHGHCQGRTVADVRVRVDELLKADHTGTTLAGLDFDEFIGPGEFIRSATVAAPSLGKPDDHVTEDDLASMFEDSYKHLLRYDHARGRWLRWNTEFWMPDRTAEVATVLVPELLRRYRDSLIDATPGRLRTLGKVSLANAIEGRARGVLGTDGSEWDTDPGLLGVPGGEVDLKTGALTSGAPAHMITKQTLVAPDPRMKTPLWDQFLWDSTGGDPDVISFLQAWSGYCLTGDTSEEVFVFIYGPGGTGKGTFLHTVTALAHDYATRAEADTFMRRKHDAHPEEIARLAGARLVTVSEIEANRTFNLARIKDLTGRDGKITARFMRENSFEFTAEFKLTFVGNHQPRLPEVDDALRRRLVLVPFTQKPRHVDTTLKDHLIAEYPGILAWMIAGEVSRRNAGGLTALIPAAVATATDEYMTEQDTITLWAAERCEFDPNFRQPTVEAFSDYRAWCHAQGLMIHASLNDFTKKFLVRFSSCTRHQSKRNNGIKGFRLVPEKPAETLEGWNPEGGG